MTIFLNLGHHLNHLRLYKLFHDANGNDDEQAFDALPLNVSLDTIIAIMEIVCLSFVTTCICQRE